VNRSPRSFARHIRFERVVWVISVVMIITGIMEMRRRATPPLSILNRRIAHIEMRGVSVAQALKQIGSQAGAAIVVDGAELEAENVDLNAPVSIDWHDVELGPALKRLISASQSDTAIEVRDGRIYITSARKLPAYTRLYDVRDIVDRWAAVPPIKDETEFQSHSAWMALPPPLTRDELAAKIAEAIAVVIDSYSKTPARSLSGPSLRMAPAGSPAPVSSVGTIIAVHAPRSVHQTVGVFLQRFRESVLGRPDQ
jgi:hypothetical protein